VKASPPHAEQLRRAWCVQFAGICFGALNFVSMSLFREKALTAYFTELPESPVGKGQ
jgi:hypothetical protein